MCSKKADNLLLFKSIVEAGSLSAAAKNCYISVSQASKRMTHLESSLGVQLLHRSTRKLTLTPAGEVLYDQTVKVKQHVDLAWDSVLEYSNAACGELRIAAPTYYGLNTLMPFIKRFNELYPQINASLELIHDEKNFEKSNYDMHFQSHRLQPGQLIPDSDFCAKKIESEEFAYVAAQSYIDEHGTPERPKHFDQHKCLAMNTNNKEWSFFQDNTLVNQPIETIFETNNFEALFQACAAGMGIAQLPTRLLDKNSHKHDLITLLDDCNKGTLDTYSYYTANKSMSKKASLFLEELLKDKQVNNAEPQSH